jgi:hypothetical protein
LFQLRNVCVKLFAETHRTSLDLFRGRLDN